MANYNKLKCKRVLMRQEKKYKAERSVNRRKKEAVSRILSEKFVIIE